MSSVKTMYAVARRNHFDPAALARDSERFDEFQRVHAGQPGYAGNLLVDLGDGELFTVTLWDTEEHARAAFSALGPVVQRMLEPLMNAPSELVATGHVLSTDLPARPRES